MRNEQEVQELVLVFSQTHQVIAAEKKLLAAGFEVRVMSIPGAIQAGCGLGLRVSLADGERALAALQEDDEKPSLFIRRPGPSGSAYTPYTAPGN